MVQKNFTQKVSEPEVGNTYKVVHDRKGKFFMKVEGFNGDMVNGFITDGQANALCEENIVHKHSPITINKSLCTFYI